MITILFPGQGAQFKGMGKNLFPLYREQTEMASEILGYSIEQLCTVDDEGKLRFTQYTQPALYVVNALNYFQRRDEGAALPAFAAGHSLGEYNALLAAGVFSFETGLRLVKQRGELMGAAKNGAMAAVLGTDEETLTALLKEHQLSEIDLANFNTLSQIVIAGPKESILKAEKLLSAQNIRCVVLNVSAAFHSRYMKAAQQEFSGFLRQFNFDAPQFPVIANATARPYRDGETAEMLARQIASPVRWTDTIRYLMGKGCTQFVEMGGGIILTRMVDDIQKTATPLVVAEDKPQVISAQQNGSGAAAKEKEKPTAPLTPTAFGELPSVTPEALGSLVFRERFGLKYAYAAGGMYRGIAGPKLVVRMAKAGMLSSFGTGGLPFDEVERGLQQIQRELRNGEPYAVNLLSNYSYPEVERRMVDLYLRYNVRLIEAAAFMQMTPALVLFRLKGLKRGPGGGIESEHRILAKISRPEVAESFMSPAPRSVVEQLLKEGQITPEEAELAKQVPMSSDICVEADSGGHTDRGIPTVLYPAMKLLKQRLEEKFGYAEPICMGFAGGIGTPEAAAAAFLLGADFILTGSINQCTVDAGISDDAKDLLQDINVQDTEYAPAGDMFETGALIQVLKKGVFFPTRANKLFSIYSHFNNIDEIPEKAKKQIQNTYFKKTFEEVWQETRDYFKAQDLHHEIVKAEANPKHKMALIFRWYFGYSSRLAHEGAKKERINYQVHTGPALGAFNQWVKGTTLEPWTSRHADEIGKMLLTEAAAYLSRSMARIFPVVAGSREDKNSGQVANKTGFANSRGVGLDQ